MAVDLQTLKKLRGITHAPLGACKSALEESGGDIDKAQDILRKQGALKAAKKADRDTNEGAVFVDSFGDKVVGIKLACETDFVAKNEKFHQLAHDLIKKLSTLDQLSSYKDINDDIRRDLENVIKENFVIIGENMKIIDAFVLSGKHYVYRHPGNKIVSIVFYDGEEGIAKNVALQVAAMNPSYLTVDDVPQEEKDKYKNEFVESLKDSGKPSDIIDRIVDGKLQKIRSEFVLLEQKSIVDDTKKVKDILGDTKIKSYIRFSI